MSITKIYGGFNPAWRAGQLEREIVDSIALTLGIEYPNKKCVVVVTSWHEPSDLIKEIVSHAPDITIICSLSDPLGPIENILSQIPGKVMPFGYVENGIKFDFWALACSKFFKSYTTDELYLLDFENIFLNYNRKPHRHRTELVSLLEKNNLVKHGIITLGNSHYSINDYAADYKDYGANDVIGDVGIPNDIYSLGRLDIWNKCFLNIVSETQYEYSPNVFVSEKIYKPIIGLRPFIINGSPGIYNWLKNVGFDCFEDIFPINDLLNEIQNYTYKFQTHKYIVSCIQHLLKQDIKQLYNNLQPRLLYNRSLFYEHANNQNYNFKFKF